MKTFRLDASTDYWYADSLRLRGPKQLSSGAERQRGFTFIERLMSIAIIAVLIGLLLATVQEKREAANSQRSIGRFHRIAEPLPTLQGQPALDYLKQRGLYDQLLAAHEASRYELVPAPADSLRLALEPTREAYLANNSAQQIKAHFSGEQVLLSSYDTGYTASVAEAGEPAGMRGWRLGLKLESVGYGHRQVAMGPGTLTAQANRIEYARQFADAAFQPLTANLQPPLTEWYVNGQAGIEQGFTLNEPPGVNVLGQPLRVTLSLIGDLQANLSADGQELSLRTEAGEAVLRYAKLSAYDALGRELAARLELDGHKLSLVVEDADAMYPVTIDPTFTQQAYLKASNTDSGDQFGFSVAVSGDTVVVGAPSERSNATGVNGNQSDNSAVNAGAAYVFVRTGVTWSQQAYLKASNTDAGDLFGTSVAVSGDTVVVGARFEDSNATGVNGNQSDNSAGSAGAAYVFARTGVTWSQQAYLKASNTDAGDLFGTSVAVSGDTVVVGANGESSNATGVNGNQSDNSAGSAGAAYVFVRSGVTWSQQAYLKASNTDAGDNFGRSVAVSGDTVVVGAYLESSNATGVNGNQSDNSAGSAGAAYVFVRSGVTWSQQAYLKASNTDANDQFGRSVAVSDDTVVVGAINESSSATGVNGNQSDNSAVQSGAAYVFAVSCTITCPADQFASTGPGATQCCAVVSFAPTAAGACGTVTCSPASGSCFPVGTTMVTCSTTAGPSCQFMVTVTDNTPPVITCPGDINVAGAASCPIGTSETVSFTVTASDNCPGVTSSCTPPSGSSFPVGKTTVNCKATDASGNMATCSFMVTAFSFCLQDETNPGNFVLINANTGDYSFFCNGVLIASGKGTLITKVCIGSIEHVKGDRRVYMEWDTTAQGGKGAGTAIVQLGVNNTRCQITDKNMSNNTCTAPTPNILPIGKPNKGQIQN